MISVIEPQYFHHTPIAMQLISAKHYPAHIHSKELEIILCLKGSAHVVTAGDDLVMAPGDIVTLDQDDIHCIYSEEENLLALVHLNLKQSAKYSWEDDLRYRFIATNTWINRPYTKTAIKQIRRILLSLLFVYASEGAYDPAEFRFFYEELLGILVEEFSWPYKNDIDAQMNNEIKSRLNNINVFIQKNYREHITIKQLSERNNINENYFSQFMKKTSFGGFKEMLAYFRCFNAEHLLLKTDMSGEQVSRECGFSSSKYFYRWFRHFWKRTPLQHRQWYKQYQQQPDDYRILTPKEAMPIVESYIAETLKEDVLADLHEKQ